MKLNQKPLVLQGYGCLIWCQQTSAFSFSSHRKALATNRGLMLITKGLIALCREKTTSKDFGMTTYPLSFLLLCRYNCIVHETFLQAWTSSERPLLHVSWLMTLSDPPTFRNFLSSSYICVCYNSCSKLLICTIFLGALVALSDSYGMYWL